MPSHENITWGEEEFTVKGSSDRPAEKDDDVKSKKDKSRDKSKDQSRDELGESASKDSKSKKKSDDGKSDKKKSKKKSDSKKGNSSEKDLADRSNETNRSSGIDNTGSRNNATEKKEDRNEIRPATRRDFYADDDEDDEDNSRYPYKCDKGRSDCEDDCNRMRGRRRENDRCDACGMRKVEYTGKVGACFVQDYSEKKRNDCSVGGECCSKQKDPCGVLCVGKRDSGRGIADKRCWKCREDKCDGNDERGYRKPERCRDDGCRRDYCRSEKESGKCPPRCDRDWLSDDRCCRQDYNRRRDWGMDRDAYDRQGGRRQTMDETGEGMDGGNRPRSSPNTNDDKQDDTRKNDDRSKSQRYDGSSTKGDKPKDELSQLRKELLCLQGEMEKMRLCLKTAVVLAEKNKCTMTKVKEYIRCNLPDFCKIREKLKQCQLLRLKVYEECPTSSPKTKKEFEYLLCELKTLKCELDKLKLERR